MKDGDWHQGAVGNMFVLTNADPETLQTHLESCCAEVAK